MTMKNCANCNTVEATIGMFCRPCNAALAVMPFILKHWSREEMGSLRDWLRRGTTRSVMDDATEKNARLQIQLARRIMDQASGELHADTVKSRLCDCLNEEISAVDSIGRFEAKNGEGSWNRKAAEAVGSWVSAIAAGQ